MSAWSLIVVPLSLTFVVGILVGVSWFEQRVLSSSALIRYSARCRHLGADTVELFVSAQSEPLLRNLRRPAPSA